MRSVKHSEAARRNAVKAHTIVRQRTLEFDRGKISLEQILHPEDASGSNTPF